MVTIYAKSGAVLLQVEVDSTSYALRRLMGDHSIVLNYSLPEHVEVPIGSYCVFQGETYTLVSPEALKMHHSRNYEYTVTFEAAQSKAKFWKFRNPVDGRLTFSLTARPQEHLQMLVENLNRRDSGWTAGDCIDAVEKVISYDHSSCLEALRAMADAFDTEWKIDGKRVSLRKVEYNRSQPLALSYGRGKGFKPGIGRSNFTDAPAVEILLPQGGERNIDASSYMSPTLLLPKGQSIAYDGQKFEDEPGFIASASRTYITEADGRSLYRQGRSFETYAEESLDCSEYYPKRVGVVTSVEVSDKGIYTIHDDTIPDTLDYGEHILPGETMTVIFQSGQLAGREFEVRYKHSHKVFVEGEGEQTVYDKAFTLVPAVIDSVDMPGGSFIPSAGGLNAEPDTYAVFNCALPSEYICDDDSRTGASWDMFRAAVRYLYEHEDQRFSFTGELDGIWAKGDWENIGGKIVLGGCVSFTDSHFQDEPALVRIIGIRQYINNPHSPEIELSNATVSGGFSTSLKKIESTEVVVEERHKEAMSYTKRRFRDAQETMEMLAEAFNGDYQQPIRPATIQTLMALIGDERLQFRFVTMPTASNPSGSVVGVNVTPDAATDTITISVPQNSCLHHLTMDNHMLTTAGNAASGAKYYWPISTFLSGELDREKSYYIYAKCSKGTAVDAGLGINLGSGEFYISAATIPMDGSGADTDFYYFLVGTLGRPDAETGERSYTPVYGFSEILPGRITTDIIRSADGTSVIDLLLGRMMIGNARNGLSWNKDGDGKLVIRGAIQVDGGGNEGPAIVRRGAYSPSLTYYWGNVVTYNGSSYMCLDDTVGGISNIPPTNTGKWELFAERGAPGSAGNYTETRYAISTSATVAPQMPSNRYTRDITAWGWYTTRPAAQDGRFIWKTTAVISGSDGTVWDGWLNPWLDTALKGDDGQDGAPGRDGIDGQDGTDGKDGKDGKYTRFQYAVSAVNYATDTNGNWSFSGIPAGLWDWNYPTTSLTGMYVWVRQMEYDPEAGTWSEVPNSRGWWRSPNETTVDVEGRDQTARYLGYPNWEAFENAVGASDVIIRDGFLNAALIQTKALVADAIFTALAGQRLILSGSSMIVNDASNKPVMAFSGDSSYASIASFVQQSSGNPSAYFSVSGSFTKNLSSEEFGALSLTSQQVNTSGSINLQGTVSYSYDSCPLPSVQIVRSAGVTDNDYFFDIQLFYTDGSTNYPAGRVFVTKNHGGFQTSASGTLPPGVYTLAAVVSGSVSGDLSNAYNSGTLTVNISATSTRVYFTPVNQGTEVFTNGMGYRYDADEYMAAVRASGGLEWAVRSGNYGMRLDSSGVGMMRDGSTWINPLGALIEVAAYITVVSGNASVTSQSSMTGNYVTVSRTGVGTYTVSFSKSVGSNACITVTPRNTSTSSTSMMWISSQTGTSMTVINRTSSSGGSATADVNGFSIMVIKTN